VGHDEQEHDSCQAAVENVRGRIAYLSDVIRVHAVAVNDVDEKSNDRPAQALDCYQK